MPTPLNFTLAPLKGHLPIYIEFECVLKEDETDDLSTNDNTPQQQVSDTITNVLMKKCDHFVSFKREYGRNNVKQYNALINLTRDHKFGVRAPYLLDFESFPKLLASLLWDIDSHYCTFLKLLASFLWDIDSHYCTFLKLLASLLWDIDSHYCTMR